MDSIDLANRFAYHPPKDAVTMDYHASVREYCLDLAGDLNDILPESREKSLAITHLEQTMMWANAAIARH